MNLINIHLIYFHYVVRDERPEAITHCMVAVQSSKNVLAGFYSGHVERSQIS